MSYKLISNYWPTFEKLGTIFHKVPVWIKGSKSLPRLFEIILLLNDTLCQQRERTRLYRTNWSHLNQLRQKRQPQNPYPEPPNQPSFNLFLFYSKWTKEANLITLSSVNSRWNWDTLSMSNRTISWRKVVDLKTSHQKSQCIGKQISYVTEEGFVDSKRKIPTRTFVTSYLFSLWAL